ncbi:uncharacterized protein LOC144911650 isoform X2 [Branchiostoma floridae x Branchiostoma belcheri]
MSWRGAPRGGGRGRGAGRGRGRGRGRGGFFPKLAPTALPTKPPPQKRSRDEELEIKVKPLPSRDDDREDSPDWIELQSRDKGSSRDGRDRGKERRGSSDRGDKHDKAPRDAKERDRDRSSHGKGDKPDREERGSRGSSHSSASRAKEEKSGSQREGKPHKESHNSKEAAKSSQKRKESGRDDYKESRDPSSSRGREKDRSKGDSHGDRRDSKGREYDDYKGREKGREKGRDGSSRDSRTRKHEERPSTGEGGKSVMDRLGPEKRDSGEYDMFTGGSTRRSRSPLEEGLRITVGNDRYWREQAAKKPLEARLGPPPDDLTPDHNPPDMDRTPPHDFSPRPYHSDPRPSSREQDRYEKGGYYRREDDEIYSRQDAFYDRPGDGRSRSRSDSRSPRRESYQDRDDRYSHRKEGGSSSRGKRDYRDEKRGDKPSQRDKYYEKDKYERDRYKEEKYQDDNRESGRGHSLERKEEQQKMFLPAPTQWGRQEESHYPELDKAREAARRAEEELQKYGIIVGKQKREEMAEAIRMGEGSALRALQELIPGFQADTAPNPNQPPPAQMEQLPASTYDQRQQPMPRSEPAPYQRPPASQSSDMPAFGASSAKLGIPGMNAYEQTGQAQPPPPQAKPKKSILKNRSEPPPQSSSDSFGPGDGYGQPPKSEGGGIPGLFDSPSSGGDFFSRLGGLNSGNLFGSEKREEKLPLIDTIEDEELFLYGDEEKKKEPEPEPYVPTPTSTAPPIQTVASMQAPQQQPMDIPPPSVASAADLSNDKLRNILQSIGFDFEKSQRGGQQVGASRPEDDREQQSQYRRRSRSRSGSLSPSRYRRESSHGRDRRESSYGRDRDRRETSRGRDRRDRSYSPDRDRRYSTEKDYDRRDSRYVGSGMYKRSSAVDDLLALASAPSSSHYTSSTTSHPPFPPPVGNAPPYGHPPNQPPYGHPPNQPPYHGAPTSGYPNYPPPQQGYGPYGGYDPRGPPPPQPWPLQQGGPPPHGGPMPPRGPLIPGGPPHLAGPPPPVTQPDPRANLRSIPIQDKKDDKKTEVKTEESEQKPKSNRIVIPPRSAQQRQKEEEALKQEQARKDKELAEKQESFLEKQRQEKARQTQLKERKDRIKKRIEFLEEELERLRKQQGELLRKKRRQKDGHKDPLLVENSKLQEDIAKQISELRKQAEEVAAVSIPGLETGSSEDKTAKVASAEQSSPVKKPEPPAAVKTEPVDNTVYDFFDPGNHWCKPCNQIFTNLLEFLNHTHSRKHLQHIDPYDRPWMPESLRTERERKARPNMNFQVVPVQGPEFMLPVMGFYCQLCEEFSGDQICAEDHIKTDKHRLSYKKHLDANPFYERRRNLDKAAGMAVIEEINRRKEEEKRHKERAELQERRHEEQEKKRKRLEQQEKVLDEKKRKLIEKEKKKEEKVQELDADASTKPHAPSTPSTPSGAGKGIKLTLAGDKGEGKPQTSGFGKFTWRPGSGQGGQNGKGTSTPTGRNTPTPEDGKTSPGGTGKPSVMMTRKIPKAPPVQARPIPTLTTSLPLRKAKPEKPDRHSERSVLPVSNQRGKSEPQKLPSQEEIKKAFGAQGASGSKDRSSPEPPVPGTEDLPPRLKKAKNDDAGSDGSGVSMEMGSDYEILDDIAD